MINDQQLQTLYYDSTLSIKDILRILKTKYKVETSESTFNRHIQKIGIKSRKELKIRKNKFGHLPTCEGCEYLITDCICDGTKIAHG